MTFSGRQLHIVLISIHGLIRGNNLELGRDADTGGQITYVIELAKALARHADVRRVDVYTRQISDPKVAADYALKEETIVTGARIIRLPCGPMGYIRKELLWPHLDSYIDSALEHMKAEPRLPDIIHGHYADAGYVGAKLSALLNVPFIYTGHSLGRVKRLHLRDQGMSEQVIESRYNLTQRIEAEEASIDNAVSVIASTRQEIEDQYSIYDAYQPKRMLTIPPGLDLARFHPPTRFWEKPRIYTELTRHLKNPQKPMILAISRPDIRKNIGTLVRAFGSCSYLQQLANLVIVAGNRDDIQGMDKGPRDVLTELLLLIDRYDLYGSVALPKHHQLTDIPDLYRLAAKTRGVFVNPALTEPFGLTLIEAAASGLPVIATRDGGVRDIVSYCKNGLLIDPLDVDAVSDALKHALTNRKDWHRWSKSGLTRARRFFSWSGHVHSYVTHVKRIAKAPLASPLLAASNRAVFDRLLICDIDNTLIGNIDGLHQLLRRLHDSGQRIGFGVATGRRFESAISILREWGLPTPDVLATAVGTEIYYGENPNQDEGWRDCIAFRWRAKPLKRLMQTIPGLRLQPKSEQRRHKLSYLVDAQFVPEMSEIKRQLRHQGLQANLIYSHQAYLDVLPIRASKGNALRYIAAKWHVPLNRVLVAGDSGNDEDMLSGNTLAVVVGNHSPELAKLRDKKQIYFAAGHQAWGVMEGLDYYNFLKPSLNSEITKTGADV